MTYPEVPAALLRDPLTVVLSNEFLGDTTLDVDPESHHTAHAVACVREVAHRSRVRANVLCANQMGRTERLCYIKNVTHDKKERFRGVVCNLDVTIPQHEGEPVEPVGKMLVRVSKAHILRLNVPLYEVLQIEYTLPGEKVSVGFTCEDPQANTYWMAAEIILNGASKWHDPIEQTVPAGKKVGRNEICPCGSGRKFKKCCRPTTIKRDFSD